MKNFPKKRFKILLFSIRKFLFIKYTIALKKASNKHKKQTKEKLMFE